MIKVRVFGAIAAVSVAGFIASFYLLSASYRAQSVEAYVPDMMRRMMGGWSPMGQTGGVEPPLYLTVLPSAFIATLIFGVGGLVYFTIMPEMKLSKTRAAAVGPAYHSEALKQDRFSTILKTMKPDEEKVFKILASHGGKYLQKHLSKEAELSRLKTHRIIARLAGRGIVNVRAFGNTNEVAISEWLLSEEGAKKEVRGP